MRCPSCFGERIYAPNWIVRPITVWCLDCGCIFGDEFYKSHIKMPFYEQSSSEVQEIIHLKSDSYVDFKSESGEGE